MLRSRILLACTLAMAALSAATPAAKAAPVPRSVAISHTMVAELNYARSRHGLPALQPSRLLRISAGAFSRYIVRRDYFGHAASIHASSRFRRLGEVLEIHYRRGYRFRGTVNAWLNSPSHRAVLLSPRWRYVGAGQTTGRVGRGRATVWVAHFGA